MFDDYELFLKGLFEVFCLFHTVTTVLNLSRHNLIKLHDEKQMSTAYSTGFNSAALKATVKNSPEKLII